MRAEHARKLDQEYVGALRATLQRRTDAAQFFGSDVLGAYLEIDVVRDKSTHLSGLEDRRRDIELVTLKTTSEETGTATIFVPAASQDVLKNKIAKYAIENTTNGAPKHQNLVARINHIRPASLQSLYTDSEDRYPERDDIRTWWEIWLRAGHACAFRVATERLGLRFSNDVVNFPERDVALIEASVSELQLLMDGTGVVAELRTAKDSPSFFLQMGAIEGAPWAADLAARIQYPEEPLSAVALLDTGVNAGHPLLLNLIDDRAIYSYNAAWGKTDSNGHGTAMAGLVLFGDLFEALASADPISVGHTIESVKILPDGGAGNDPELYAALTRYAVALPEVDMPHRKRVFCLATTSDVAEYHGQPSSWSAEIDELSFGFDAFSRLFICAAGNVRDGINAGAYIAANDLAEIEDPAQAWNALCVGAYTEQTTIVDETYADWEPTAVAGDLSPRSRTSTNWGSQWPIKPDVVFEGGNLATAPGEHLAYPLDDLSLLTTCHAFPTPFFTAMRDTSAAAALASKFGATILSEYQSLRPETVRALIVHSARWTPAMLAHAPHQTKTEKRTLLRRYGYGVPDLAVALKSARNDLTMIVEDKIRPFKRENGTIKNNELKFHKLPWPRDLLEAVGDASAELRITLSYFVEPNPGERGWLRRHDYASHGLRFEVMKPAESTQQFRERINKAARDDGEPTVSPTDDARWELGIARNKGSIHSDYWRGTAAELANRGAIAVYPVGGWWKENLSLDRWRSDTWYTLLVTLRVPDVDVDIYSSIAVALEIEA